MESKEALYKNLSYLLIPLLVLIDLLIKDYSVKYLEFGVPIKFLPFIDLLLIYNSGIAFGMFDLDQRIFSNRRDGIGCVRFIVNFWACNTRAKPVRIFKSSSYYNRMFIYHELCSPKISCIRICDN